MTEVGKRLIAGAMSGTSADGVDVALVETTGRGLAMQAKPVAHAYQPFTPELRTRILQMRQAGSARFEELARMGREVTLAHVAAFRAAIEKAGVTAADVAAIGAHGQTLWHGPPNTIQYFDPSLLAIQTGCAVVSDFRRADLAVGGQGAPLVPFADWILFRHPTKSRVILNIGGIANLTYLKAGGSIDDVVAFDTGPGNCISDWVIQTYYPDEPGYDADGHIAREGSTLAEIAEAFADHPFLRKGPPKSTDGPEMIHAFQTAIHDRMPIMVNPPADMRGSLVRTAVGVANAAIWDAIPMTRDWPDEVIVAGGGVRNPVLMDLLRDKHFRRTASVFTTEELGIATDAREAIAFALLAAATLDGEPSNVPSATGASRRVVLGSITPRPI